MTATNRRRGAGAPLFLLLLLSISTLLAACVAPSRAMAAEPWRWPVDGQVLTAYANGDDPYAAGQHRGIDIRAPAGSVVRAATAGTVSFAGTAGSSGLTVSIRTEDDRFDTSYLHLESIDVREGDVVEPGSQLGAVGVSGRRSAEAPHVHFGVRDAGERHAYHDPLLFLGAPGAPAPEPAPPPVAPPARPVPRPAPVPAPSPRPSPVPVPAPSALPSRAPSPANAPSPKGAPSTAPLPGPQVAARPLPVGAPRPSVRSGSRLVDPGRPVVERVPSRSPAPEPAPRPASGPGDSRVIDPGRGPVSANLAPEVPPRQPAAAAAEGFDLGWALACAGLGVAAAMVLGPRRRRRRSAGVTAPAAPAAPVRPLTDRG